MILAVDAGNTRIKWAVHAAGEWQATGALPTVEAPALAQAWRSLDPPARIVVSNVAGDRVQAAIVAAADRFAQQPVLIASQAAQCGVRSSYEQPAQLGCDRWAALIGAHHLYPGAALVVNAGTALTIDALTDDGLFLGGLIVPGLDLMRRALDAHTAALRLQPGEVRFFPSNTGDAIMSGAVHALAGAIERMASFMRESGQEALRVLLSGGAAARLTPFVALETVVVEHLVLEGLVTIAREMD